MTTDKGTCPRKLNIINSEYVQFAESLCEDRRSDVRMINSHDNESMNSLRGIKYLQGSLWDISSIHLGWGEYSIAHLIEKRRREDVEGSVVSW